MTVTPVDADNWRDVARLEVATGQDEWVLPTTYYLCLCHYGGTWRPIAFVDDDLIIGFSMWALDENDGSHWIGGFQIDRHHQRQGFGRDALQALLAWLKDEQGAERVALAYDEHNEVARSLYRSEGFVETGEIEDDELVARRSLS